MEYTGVVRGSVILLDTEVELAEGTRVRVVPVEDSQSATVKEVVAEPQDDRFKSLREMLLSFAGTGEGLPEDMSSNHDHYLYGTPKK